MNFPPSVEQMPQTALVLANTYLESQKRRLQTFFNNADGGRFAKEFDATLASASPMAIAAIDARYTNIFKGNIPTDDGFLAARTIAIADELWNLMSHYLEDYVAGKGVVPPSEDAQQK